MNIHSLFTVALYVFHSKGLIVVGAERLSVCNDYDKRTTLNTKPPVFMLCSFKRLKKKDEREKAPNFSDKVV